VSVDCCVQKSPLERTIVYAISMGGDTDTIASMAGAIAGAYYGIDAVSETWCAMCEGIGDAIRLADDLYDLYVSGTPLSVAPTMSPTPSATQNTNAPTGTQDTMVDRNSVEPGNVGCASVSEQDITSTSTADTVVEKSSGVDTRVGDDSGVNTGHNENDSSVDIEKAKP
jgi:hypothetical protein